MTQYRLLSEPPADLDVEATFEWYEHERAGLGLEFLDELRATYGRSAEEAKQLAACRGRVRRGDGGERFRWHRV